MSLRKSLFSALFLSTLALTAQTKQPAKSAKPAADSDDKNTSDAFEKNAGKWYFGIQGGVPLFFGDADKLKPGFSGGIHAQYNFSHVFGLRLTGNYIALNTALQDNHLAEYGYDNYSAKNSIIEGQLQMVYTLGGYSFVRRQTKVALYFYGGIGYGLTNMTADYKLTGGSDTSATYKKGIDIYTLGTGLKFRLSPAVTLGVDVGLRLTRNDSLDHLAANTVANQNTDFYAVPGLSLSFNIGAKGKEHMDWSNPVATMYDKIESVEKRVGKLEKDSDGDGVSDKFDKEPNTPAGTKVYADGTTMDSDEDGVPDGKDEEPNSPKGAQVDPNTGRAADTDEDGVPDVNDLSPNTDSKKFITNHQGIPIMSKEDADGIVKGGKSGLTFLPAVFFASGDASPYPIHLNDLQQIAVIMNSNKALKLEVIGHADNRSGEAFNQALALRRAETVKKILVEQFKVDASRLETKSMGEKDPIAKGSREIDYQANRRVQFFVKK